MEKQHTMHGVNGRLTVVPRGDSPEFNVQQFVATRTLDHEDEDVIVKVRFDDNCRNGHNTFAIGGDIYKAGRRSDSAFIAGGCIHEEIASVFPELAHLIKWHLCSTDGPIHYAANVVYFAGDRDCHGLREGEQRQLRNGRTGKPAWILTADKDLPKHVNSDTRPTDTAILSYQPWTRTGEGKARELDSARRAAIWPEATDAELMQEPDALRAALEVRLPDLLAEFRRDIEAAGLLWEPAD